MSKNLRDFRTYRLAVAFYRLAAALQLPHHLKSQLNRAALSIVNNLTEGSGRRTRRDKAKFYRIAFGSLRECQGILDVSLPEGATEIAAADEVAASLYCLLKSTERG